eukprot:GHVS01072058.1.p1 GENE.GHVS01072058.1~~GHVS01072058.1.p1  ORF type:complete len:808 (+),score=148.53 GHVS01072058.1:1402-3825(+)
MPGAYEKQMQGGRYERMVERVKQCRRALADPTMHHDLISVHLPLLTVEVGHDKKSVEEFCYAEGLLVMCEILKERRKHETLGDAMGILQEFSSLLCKEFNPFDDDIGYIPLLVYFLSERHKYYVDINWMPHELTFMKIWIEAHLALLSTPTSSASLPQNTRLAAVNTLYVSLLTFPPHRVVSQMAECFHTEGCNALVEAVRGLPALMETAKGRRRLSQLLAAVTFFGLGLQVSWELTHSQLLWATSVNLAKQLRCPCSKCEMHRRLQKVARNRDEFGVIKAQQAKQGICIGFVEGGGLQLLLDVLKRITREFKVNKAKCNTFEPLIPLGTGQLSLGEETNKNHQDDDEEEEDGENEHHNGEEKDVQNSSVDQAKLEEDESFVMIGDETRRIEETLRQDAEAVRQQKADEIIETIADPNDPRLDDEARHLCSLVVLLCSWPYERLHGQSILTLNNNSLLASMLASVDLSDLRKTFNVETCTFLPGVRTVLEVVSALVLQAKDNERRELLKITTPTMEALIRRTSEKLVDRCGRVSEHWHPAMGQFGPLLCGMLQQVYLATHPPTANKRKLSKRKEPPTVDGGEEGEELLEDDCDEDSDQEEEEGDGGTEASAAQVSRETFKVAVAACQTMLDGYEYRGVDIDARVFLTSLVACMGILVGTMEYVRLPERRRRFMAPPDVICGWMAGGCRRLLEMYGKISAEEGCVFVKQVAQVVILRAEKASALIPASRADPAEQLRERVIRKIEILKSEGRWGIDEDDLPADCQPVDDHPTDGQGAELRSAEECATVAVQGGNREREERRHEKMEEV